ncbi:MAG: iron-containing alcohol dehydrogenase [Actinobacteria bacterium]|nr:iron-containing alcohol dehydrogenase [Actinomycetota bacterium]
MENFIFQNSTRIIFGKGTEEQVGSEVSRFSKKILLHYGGGSIKKIGLYDRVIKSLKESKIDYIELPGVKPNPRLSLVREGIKICRKNNIDFILAVGGGSVIDSAKAIAIGVPYDGDVWDFFTRKVKGKEAIPIGVVLTIPAAGSETSMAAVITNEEQGLKLCNIGIEKLRPRFSILNSELTFSLPPYQTASGAVDIMAHVMERYFTQTRDVDITDRLCEATLKTMIKFVPIVLAEPRNYAARAEIMWAGTIAHNDLLGTGRVEDWSSHNIEHGISSINDMAHGAGLAIVFPAWMKYVYRANVNRFAQFAIRVWNVEQSFDSQKGVALEGINKLESFFRYIDMPCSLREIGIGRDHFDEIAAITTFYGSIGNLMKLNKEDVIKILDLATY